jgi:hypothetical protein
VPNRPNLIARVRDVMRGDAERARQDAPVVPAPPAAPRIRSRKAPANAELQQCEAEARYHRDRLALYRARLLGSTSASPGRLRELERVSAAADERLAHLKRRSR